MDSVFEHAQKASAPRVPLRGKKLRIMPVGDSITTGGATGNGTLSYRSRLVKHLAGNDVEMVGNTSQGNMKPPELNRGEFVPGRTIEAITEQLRAKNSLGRWRPNLVLLHIGTNDCVGQKDTDTLKKHLEVLLEMIMEKCPDAVVVVAQITPIAFRGKEVLSYNRQVAELVAKRNAAGKHILSVDMYEAFEFEGHPNYLADVAHPNQYGHVVLADKWMSGIEKAHGLGWFKDPVHTTGSCE